MTLTFSAGMVEGTSIFRRNKVFGFVLAVPTIAQSKY
jgi:hypothetical protein